MPISSEQVFLGTENGICYKCGKTKPLTKFPQYHIKKHCRQCCKKYLKEWANKNRSKINENQRKYYSTIHGRASVLLNAALKRAKAKGDEFLLTHDHVVKGLIVGFCSKTFLPFDLSVSERKGSKYKINPLSPSIDKIDPFGIYEPSNVQYVCSWYNLAKGQMTEEELLSFCKRVVSISK